MKLVELKALCKKYDVEPVPTKHRLNPDRYEVSMDDCIKAIRGVVTNALKNKNLYDNNLDFILKMKSPMLAALISKQDDKTARDIWDDNNMDWVFEEKLDGIRCFLAYNHLTNVYHIYSRALDPSTLLPVDYADKIKLTSNKIPFDFILDTELVFNNMDHNAIEEVLSDPYKNISKYKPRFVVFDLVKLGDSSLVQQPLWFRRREAFKVTNYLMCNGLKNVSIIREKPFYSSKEDYYNYVINSGLEGIVVKNLNSTYDITGGRNGSWTKIKRRPYEGMGSLVYDTHDLFITGATFLNNLVSGLVLSSYKVNKDNEYIYDKFGNRLTIELGVVYNLSLEDKRKLTVYSNNRPELNTKYLNAVIEVSSSGYNPTTRRYNNLQFIRWRLDRTQESCKISDSELLSNV